MGSAIKVFPGRLSSRPRPSGSHFPGWGKVGGDLFSSSSLTDPSTPAAAAPQSPSLRPAPQGRHALAARGPQRAVQGLRRHPWAIDASLPRRKRVSGLPKVQGGRQERPELGWRRGGQRARRRAVRLCVRSGVRAASRARFVYARAESDFIRAAAPPPRSPRPAPPEPAHRGDTPLAAPSSPALLPLPPVSRARLGWGRARRAPARTAACCASLCRGAAGRALPGRAAVRLGGRLSRPESQGLRVCRGRVCTGWGGGGERLCARAWPRARSCLRVWISVCLRVTERPPRCLGVSSAESHCATP